MTFCWKVAERRTCSSPFASPCFSSQRTQSMDTHTLLTTCREVHLPCGACIRHLQRTSTQTCKRFQVKIPKGAPALPHEHQPP